MIPKTYVDWYCRDCGHENETNRYAGSYPVKCPKCKKESTTSGYPSLPINSATRDTKAKRYSYCTADKEIQVYLRSATGETAGKVMDPDWVPDCDDDPVTVAESVLNICNTKYIYCGNKDIIEKVCKAMKDCKDLSDKNIIKNRQHELRKAIVLDIIEYNDLGEEK